MYSMVPFSMATGNVELMHKCFPKHLRMGTTKMKEQKRLAGKNENGKKESGHEIKNSTKATESDSSLPPQGRYCPKQWTN